METAAACWLGCCLHCRAYAYAVHCTPQSLVRHEMATTYGADKVVAVNVVRDTSKVDPMLTRYEQLKSQLTDITDDYISKIKRNKPDIKRKQVTLLPAMATKWAKERYNVGAKPVKVGLWGSVSLDSLCVHRQASNSRVMISKPIFLTDLTSAFRIESSNKFILQMYSSLVCGNSRSYSY